MLADPPFTPHGENDEAARAQFAEEAARLQELHDKGDHRGSVKLFLGGMGVPDDDVEEMLYSPAGAGMRLISMTTRDELVMALAGRYALGSRADRGRMLDEFA